MCFYSVEWENWTQMIIKEKINLWTEANIFYTPIIFVNFSLKRRYVSVYLLCVVNVVFIDSDRWEWIRIKEPIKFVGVQTRTADTIDHSIDAKKNFRHKQADGHQAAYNFNSAFFLQNALKTIYGFKWWLKLWQVINLTSISSEGQLEMF